MIAKENSETLRKVSTQMKSMDRKVDLTIEKQTIEKQTSKMYQDPF